MAGQNRILPLRVGTPRCAMGGGAGYVIAVAACGCETKSWWLILCLGIIIPLIYIYWDIII